MSESQTNFILVPLESDYNNLSKKVLETPDVILVALFTNATKYLA